MRMDRERKYNKHQVVLGISTRLEKFAHLKLQNFNPTITSEPWSDNPPGFKFLCQDLQGLARALRFSRRFGLATARRDG